jgi:hypothetical protein
MRANIESTTHMPPAQDSQHACAKDWLIIYARVKHDGNVMETMPSLHFLAASLTFL